MSVVGGRRSIVGGHQSAVGGRFSAETVLALPPLAVALAYLVGLTVAEVLTVFSEPRIGLALHSMLLAILLLHAALVWDQPVHRLLIALAFAPLIRLISLSLPLVRFPLVYWYFITSIPLFVAAFLASRILNLSWRRDLGLNLRKLPIQVVVGLTGFVFGYIEYQILEPDALASSFTWQQVLIPALILLISTGFFEELIFRGLMQNTSLGTLGRFGLLFVALIFAVLHIGYKSLMDILFVFAVGLFFGWVVYKTNSIIGATVSHGVTNAVLFLVMPFLAIGAIQTPDFSAIFPAVSQPPAATATPTAATVATLSAAAAPMATATAPAPANSALNATAKAETATHTPPPLAATLPEDTETVTPEGSAIVDTATPAP